MTGLSVHRPGTPTCRGPGCVPHKDRVRYRWEQGRQRHWFKRFGLEADVDVQNGQVRPLGSLPLTQRAPELLHFASYTPTDDYYGLPNVTPAIGGMVMDLLAREFNLKFFDNNAVPQYVVLFEGVEDEVSEDTMRVIQDFFASSRATPHRTLVLSTPASPAGSPTAASSLRSWRWRSGRGHFRYLREEARNEVLVAHAVPGYRLGLAITGQLGGSNIREADEIYKAEEVDPRRGGAGGTHQPPHSPPGLRHRELVLPLSAVGHQRLSREADTWVKLASLGFVTPNEGREALGLERVEGRPRAGRVLLRGAAPGRPGGGRPDGAVCRAGSGHPGHVERPPEGGRGVTVTEPSTQEERRLVSLTTTLVRQGVLPVFYRTPRRQVAQAKALQEALAPPLGRRGGHPGLPA